MPGDTVQDLVKATIKAMQAGVNPDTLENTQGESLGERIGLIDNLTEERQQAATKIQSWVKRVSSNREVNQVTSQLENTSLSDQSVSQAQGASEIPPPPPSRGSASSSGTEGSGAGVGEEVRKKDQMLHMS